MRHKWITALSTTATPWWPPATGICGVQAGWETSCAMLVRGVPNPGEQQHVQPWSGQTQYVTLLFASYVFDDMSLLWCFTLSICLYLVFCLLCSELGYHFGESGNASLCRDSNKLSWLHSNMWTNMLSSFSITVLIVNLFTDASVILISFFFASEPWDLEDLNLSVSWRSKYTRWIIFHGKLLPVIMCTRFLLCGF